MNDYRIFIKGFESNLQGKEVKPADNQLSHSYSSVIIKLHICQTIKGDKTTEAYFADHYKYILYIFYYNSDAL